jgi:peptidoglycan/LPS O-acetylase OafA/YrhL
MFLVALVISVVAFWYDINYHSLAHQLGWGRELLGFIGFVTWRYYIFFYLGTLIKKHFNRFLQITDSSIVILVIVGLFGVIACSPRFDDMFPAYMRFVVSGICGMVMVFTFFRKFASLFTKERMLGRSLQYIGTRTLDIYLLHFFFLPESMLLYNRQLLNYGNKILEVAVVMGEALLVLAACLVASYVIRLSPFLGKYLFGVKDK